MSQENSQKTSVEPRLSATILLVRDKPDLEVLMVKRHHQIDFASGALVFPGGKIEKSDADHAWAEAADAWDLVAEDERPVRIAGLREAFEEAGILLARRKDGSPFEGDPGLADARKALAADEINFLELVRDLGLRLDLDALQPFARWITPLYMPKRFDTHFFVAAAPAEQLAVCDGWETVDAEWIAPNVALDLERAKERTIIFPTRMNLKLLAEAENAADAVARARERPRVTVTPWVEKRPEGQVLVIPPDAGYGAVEEDLSSVGG
jgi:8-oxo-dGTP pyrophosphatase MutT (NUDIX family)